MSFCKKQPCPSLSVVHTGLIVSLCLRLVPSCAALQFANSEYVTAAAAKSLQSCPTLCNPIDSSPPGSPIPGILQARTLEWVAISFSNACWVRGKPLLFFHIHDIETYSCFLVAHKKTGQFYFLEKLQRETKKSDVLKVIEIQPLWLSLLPFVVLTSS